MTNPTQDPTLPEPIDAAGLLEGVTPGDWSVSYRMIESQFRRFVGCGGESNGGVWVAEVKGPDCVANAELIAQSKALAADVLRLREENERLQNELDGANDAWRSSSTRWITQLSTLKAAAEGMAQAAKEIDRWMLVIESAVRADEPLHHQPIIDALKANRAALTLYRAATSGAG